MDIFIFWNHFSWAELEADPVGFKAAYVISQGVTDSNGNFSISCTDTAHRFEVGNITVYSVFPYLEDPRQYLHQIIDLQR